MPRISLILALLVIFLTACTIPETPTQTVLPQITATFTPTPSQTPKPSATLTPNLTEYAQATLSANATNNAAYYATSVAAMAATALVRPTLTPTPTAISSLTNREPSFEELENSPRFFERIRYYPRWREQNFEYNALNIVFFPGDVYFPDCAVQQRLLAYTWDGHPATLIADASGCVTRLEDLYGVRLEDYDGDGLPEVIAAQLDADNPERLYTFNGTHYLRTSTP